MPPALSDITAVAVVECHWSHENQILPVFIITALLRTPPLFPGLPSSLAFQPLGTHTVHPNNVLNIFKCCLCRRLISKRQSTLLTLR